MLKLSFNKLHIYRSTLLVSTEILLWRRKHIISALQDHPSPSLTRLDRFLSLLTILSASLSPQLDPGVEVYVKPGSTLTVSVGH